MKFAKILSSAAAVVALTAGVTIASPGTASAMSTLSVCKDINYSNCTSFSTTVSTLRVLGAWNDVISSIPPVPVQMCFYDDTSFGGPYMVFRAGASMTDLRNQKYIFNGKVETSNDKISSFRPC